jgi:cystathionine beta-synthase
MPVVDKDGAAVGMIHEYDLLNGLIGGAHKMNDAIDRLIAPLQGVVTPETNINKLRDVFAQDNVAVVREGQKVTAVVTKIDLIEFLAGRAA